MRGFAPSVRRSVACQDLKLAGACHATVDQWAVRGRVLDPLHPDSRPPGRNPRSRSRLTMVRIVS